jgi:hypothetical protein
MELRADWRPCLAKSTTSYGIYARRRWLGDETKTLRRRQSEAAARLRRGQREDGSWASSEAETIRRLFHLHLVGGEPEEVVRAGLDYLLEKGQPPLRYTSGDGAPYSHLFFRTRKYEAAKLNRLRGTPFTPGCSGFVKSGAALVLASLFGLEGDEAIERAFRSFDRVNAVRKGRWCSPSCGQNVLQAYSVHPRKSKGAAMRRAIAWHEAHQTRTGAFERVPFLPSLLAMSRVDLPSAGRLTRRAIPALLRRQGRDGAWGRVDREWQTLMAVEILRNAGLGD